MRHKQYNQPKNSLTSKDGPFETLLKIARETAGNTDDQAVAFLNTLKGGHGIGPRCFEKLRLEITQRHIEEALSRKMALIIKAAENQMKLNDFERSYLNLTSKVKRVLQTLKKFHPNTYNIFFNTLFKKFTPIGTMTIVFTDPPNNLGQSTIVFELVGANGFLPKLYRANDVTRIRGGNVSVYKVIEPDVGAYNRIISYGIYQAIETILNQINNKTRAKWNTTKITSGIGLNTTALSNSVKKLIKAITGNNTDVSVGQGAPVSVSSCFWTKTAPPDRTNLPSTPDGGQSAEHEGSVWGLPDLFSFLDFRPLTLD